MIDDGIMIMRFYSLFTIAILRCLSLAVDVTLHTITANFLVIIGAAIGAQKYRGVELQPHALDLCERFSRTSEFGWDFVRTSSPKYRQIRNDFRLMS